jgi:hypothetical protein
MFSENLYQRKERTGSNWADRSYHRSSSAHLPGHIPLHQRRGQTSDPWNGLLWQSKHIPAATMSTPIHETTGHLTPPRDLDDSSIYDEIEIIPPASTRLRHMINHSEKIIVAPGVYDGLSARIALSVGFDAMYMVCHSVKTTIKTSLT